MIVTFQKNLNTGYSNHKKDCEYKVPKISNNTDKGKWLNSFVGKIHLKLKTTTYKMNNDLSVMVAWFKNLKKLKQHHFVGEVFNSQLVYQPTQEAA